MTDGFFDYVVVGGGSAGCVLANRLTEDGLRVLLIEAGGKDDSPFIRVPAGTSKLLGRPHKDWCHMSMAEPGLDARRIVHSMGKVLGGSSSINGMLYARGHRADYDGWAELGCAGWSWDDVLPYFLKSERFIDPPSPLHGRNGELSVQLPRYKSEIMDRFISASVESGMGSTQDYNAPDPNGVSLGQSTIAGSARCSAARAFLPSVRSRPNLRIELNAATKRIETSAGRAVGVTYEKHGVEHKISAGEVVLSAGTINSPKLLELSGIGQKARLSSLGIPVVRDLPGVGENLHDHPASILTFRLQGTASANADTHGWRLAREIVKYGLFGRGVLMSTPGMVAGFAKMDVDAVSADIQLMARPFTPDVQRKSFVAEREAGLAVVAYPCRPRSRGFSHVASPDPAVAPAFVMNFLTDPHDVHLALESIALVRRIMAQPAIRNHVARELVPGGGVQSPGEMLAHVRRATVSAYHPVGTCKMGTDAQSVVDPRLRVHGVPGLRVIDASVMPRIVSANTNAATIMIAEKGAALMLEDRRAT